MSDRLLSARFTLFSKIVFDMTFCSYCNKLMVDPITCICGHTRCITCARKYESCLCGVPTTKLKPDKYLENIKTSTLNYLLSSKSTEDPQILKRYGLDLDSVDFDHVPTLQTLLRIATLEFVKKEYHNHGVRRKMPTWINSADIECPICTGRFKRPITTPCGHMFCKICLERYLHYAERCPMCQSNLENFNAAEVQPTSQMGEFLTYFGCSQRSRYQEYLLAILRVGPGYPNLEFSMILSAGSETFLKRLFKSRKAIFGTLPDKHGKCGTVIEIRDCLKMRDGSFIITGIGVRRFKIKHEFPMISGYALGRVVDIGDLKVTKMIYPHMMKLVLHLLATKKLWLNTLDPELRQDVELFSKTLSVKNIERSFCRNGPTWLWKLISLLPIKDYFLYFLLEETKVEKRIVVTDNLMKEVIRRANLDVSPSVSST